MNGAFFSEPRPGLRACSPSSTATSANTTPWSGRRDSRRRSASSNLCLTQQAAVKLTPRCRASAH